MSAYLIELDIMNRALQHCRMKRINAVTESNANAKEVNFAYHKCREAELREHVWRFATRRSLLMAVDQSTQLWAPPTYSAGTTYAVGAVVVDSGSIWWQSKVAANV